MALDNLYNGGNLSMKSKILMIKYSKIFKKLSQIIVRNDVLENGVRIDGRKTNGSEILKLKLAYYQMFMVAPFLLAEKLNHLLLQPLATLKIDN